MSSTSVPVHKLRQDSVLEAREADVGAMRSARMHTRQAKLALAVASVVAWIVVRSVRHAWVVPPMPHIDWTLVAPFVFFAFLIVFMIAYVMISGRSPHVVIRPEQINVSLDDVRGIDAVKDEVIRSLNLFLSHKTFEREMGGRARRGLLFEGGPGTGKTHTAKAMARAAGVPFLYASATSFHSGLQGATSRKVRMYFKTMRKLALQEGGAIGFIDEFDAIGAARMGMSGMSIAPALSHDHAGCGGLVGLPATYAQPAPAPGGVVTSGFSGGGDIGMAVNELLVQLQSFDEPVGMAKLTGKLIDKVNLFLPDSRAIKKAPVKTANIMLIAATNRADNLDPALLRPGRFDRRLTFEVPDRNGRRELVDHFLTRKAHSAELDEDSTRDAIAAVTSGFTPAMLEGMFDEALINAVRYGRDQMSRQDAETARLTMTVGMGQPKAYTEHERKVIATHEAGHTTVAWLVAPHRRLEVLSIVKRRDSLGLLAHGDQEDVYTRSSQELSNLIKISMGGQVAEILFFDDMTTGPGGDLLYATNVAATMVGSCGMTDTLISYMAVQNSMFSDTNIVGRVLADAEGRGRVEKVLQEQREAVMGLLSRNLHLVTALRDALLERDELIGHEITDVLENARAAADGQVIDLRDVPSVSAAPSVAASNRLDLPGRD
ncbi:MAG: cell division protease FtsH [Frankiales bacterium]|nr:cell division protease FtsH [Frankiales bacterium]